MRAAVSVKRPKKPEKFPLLEYWGVGIDQSQRARRSF
jgi:hypothetical protein